MGEETFDVRRYRQSFNADCFRCAKKAGLASHRDTGKPGVRCLACGEPMDFGHGEAGVVLFFEELQTVVSRDGEKRLIVLEPHQRTILREMTRRGPDGAFIYRYWIFSCVKKSGKSEIGGGLGAWAAVTMGAYNEVYFAANSKFQATTRAFAAATRCFKESALLRKKYKVKTYKNVIELGTNNTTITAASSDAGSMAGANPGMVIWDELWAFTTGEDELLWSELAPSPARRDSVTVVVTYAGFENESKLLWDLYLKGVGQDEHKNGRGTRKWDDLPVYTNGPIFCYWDHEPRMPWHTKAWLEDERLRCPNPATWLRHYQNRWASSTAAFINDEMWAALERVPVLPPGSMLPVYVGVDLGWKHDAAAVVAVAKDINWYRIANLRIWTPDKNEPLNIENTVEAFLIELHRTYNVVGVWYDPFQMVRSAQTLEAEHGMMMKEFNQTDNNMTQATSGLYRVIKHRSLQIIEDGALREHVLNAVTVTGARGERLKKEKASGRIDAAVALAEAVYGAESDDDGANFSCGTIPG